MCVGGGGQCRVKRVQAPSMMSPTGLDFTSSKASRATVCSGQHEKCVCVCVGGGGGGKGG